MVGDEKDSHRPLFSRARSGGRPAKPSSVPRIFAHADLPRPRTKDHAKRSGHRSTSNTRNDVQSPADPWARKKRAAPCAVRYFRPGGSILLPS